MKKEDFKLKRFILIDTELENVNLELIEENSNNGLDIDLSVITNDSLLNKNTKQEVFEYLMLNMLAEDGQIVRFCDYVVKCLVENCSSYFYGNSDSDINLDENSIFEEDTAEYHIPKIVSEISNRLHDEIKEQVKKELEQFK